MKFNDFRFLVLKWGVGEEDDGETASLPPHQDEEEHFVYANGGYRPRLRHSNEDW